MQVTSLYCHAQDVDAEHAKKIQHDISLLYRNFNSESKVIVDAIASIRSTFFKAMGIDTEDPRLAHLVGLTTTRGAFGIRLEDDLPPSPDDTRIAMIIGKPLPVQNDAGEWKISIEKRYVIALRVTDREKIYVTKVIPSIKRSVHSNALGMKFDPAMLEEGRKIQAIDSCCNDLVEAGGVALDTIASLTKEAVLQTVDEVTAMFDSVLSDVTKRIGRLYPSTHLTTQLKRMHSSTCESNPPPLLKRCDTEFVEKTMGSMKRVLGIVPFMADSPPPKLRRM